MVDKDPEEQNVNVFKCLFRLVVNVESPLVFFSERPQPDLLCYPPWHRKQQLKGLPTSAHRVTQPPVRKMMGTWHTLIGTHIIPIDIFNKSIFQVNILCRKSPRNLAKPPSFSRHFSETEQNLPGDIAVASNGAASETHITTVKIIRPKHRWAFARGT